MSLVIIIYFFLFIYIYICIWFILLKYQEIWQEHTIVLTLLSVESQHPLKVEFQYCNSAFQTITRQKYPEFSNVT